MILLTRYCFHFTLDFIHIIFHIRLASRLHETAFISYRLGPSVYTRRDTSETGAAPRGGHVHPTFLRDQFYDSSKFDERRFGVGSIFPSQYNGCYSLHSLRFSDQSHSFGLRSLQRNGYSELFLQMMANNSLS